MAGMLELDHETWMRPKDDEPEVLRKKVAQFVVDWDKYDWTLQLGEEENQEDAPPDS